MSTESEQSPPAPSLVRRILRAFVLTLALVSFGVGAGVFVLYARGDRIYVQQGHTMVPALPSGVRFHFTPRGDASPSRGELVLVRDAFSEGKVVRRVIGVAGDDVDLEGFAPRVNGRAIGADAGCPAKLSAGMRCMRERQDGRSWLATWSRRAHPGRPESIRSIPRGFVYVLADHRDVARDSRDPLFGLLPEHAVVGFVRLLPVRE